MIILGQPKISNILSNLSIGSLPHSLILLGERGSGKLDVANEISKMFELPIEDIKSIDIDDISLNVTPKIILINANDFSVREQNIILKNLEEPNYATFFIILCDNKNMLIDTIINRCVVWEFEPFSKDVLMHYTDNETILDMCHTPGDCKMFNDVDVNELLKLTETIFTKIGIANISNILTIPSKLHKTSLDDTSNDLKIFNKALIYTANNLYKNHTINKDIYIMANDYVNVLHNSNITPQDEIHMLEKFLLNLRVKLC